MTEKNAPVTFEEAAEYLDKLIEELPEGILDELNGGISLIPDVCPSATEGLTTLGKYFAGGPMGRYIQLYYGSFEELYGDRPRESFLRHLKKTLHHELTHHIESLAGDRSLEREDERFMDEYAAAVSGEPFYTDSILFTASEKAMSAAACEMLRALLAEEGEEMTLAAAVFEGGNGEIPDAAKKAALKYGADLSCCETVPMTKSTLSSFDAVMCMTEDEADELAEEYPEFDMRIFALGERDIECPRSNLGWTKCMKNIYDGVCALADELLAKEEGE